MKKVVEMYNISSILKTERNTSMKRLGRKFLGFDELRVT